MDGYGMGENKKPAGQPGDSAGVEAYLHEQAERLNNPPVGLVKAQVEANAGGKKSYEYDPHFDPSLQWADKAEHTSFELPTVALHVHERIDPRTIIEAVSKRSSGADQMGLFETEREVPLRQAIEFYRHRRNWTNRLIAGDSLLVMNSLLEKENMAGSVQCAYIDPPYGIKYGSNFQPFVNQRTVEEGKDLTAEPETIKAFRDTWELGVHSYLSYLRDRLLLTRDLLTASGSVFVQISDENVHHVREIMDEVFGAGNFITLIIFQKKGSQSGHFIPPINEYLVWYGKNREETKFNRLFYKRDISVASGFNEVELTDGSTRKLTVQEIADIKNDSSRCKSI